jgi:hypothetical protein
MVGPKYIYEILNEVQYGNDEKGSCRMEKLKRDSSVLTLGE